MAVVNEDKVVCLQPFFDGGVGFACSSLCLVALHEVDLQEPACLGIPVSLDFEGLVETLQLRHRFHKEVSLDRVGVEEGLVFHRAGGIKAEVSSCARPGFHSLGRTARHVPGVVLSNDGPVVEIVGGILLEALLRTDRKGKRQAILTAVGPEVFVELVVLADRCVIAPCHHEQPLDGKQDDQRDLDD